MAVLMGLPYVRHVVRDTPTCISTGVWDVELVTVGGRIFVYAQA
jgi:hypothetical protein